jgi:hypothetical protein
LIASSEGCIAMPVTEVLEDETAGGTFARRLGANLRATRMAYGLSLAGVCERSGGRWKAGTLCSYESGVRAIGLEQLAEIAAFYGVAAAELIPA